MINEKGEKMDLKGQIVVHNSFGEGKIVEHVANHLTIAFKLGDKKFLYPDAFKKFLKAKDSEVATAIEQEIANIEAEKIRIQKEVEDKAERENQKVIKKAVTRTNKVKFKVYPRSNVAFKCNFCDGGKSAEQIGFSGVCSDAVIHNNIEVENRTWCGSDESACRKFLAGDITRQELDAMCEDEQYVCYESQMLRDWRALAGIVQTGIKKGTPMKMHQVQANSLCVLTTRDPDAKKENKRYIFAVFLVDESYEGDNREEGYVTTKSEFKIKLSPMEARSMLFWKYHVNENNPENAIWSSGLHRYLEDGQAAQILKDIVALKKGTKDEELAKRFFEHFCVINNVEKETLPKPYGVLKR